MEAIKKQIPNFFSLCNLTTGLINLILVSKANFELLPYTFALCFLFDFLDGFSARMLNATSAVGKQLDSFSDFVSFGIFPAMLILVLFQTNNSFPLDFMVYIPSILIILLSALRLAIFNVSEGDSSFFIGLPTPTNALVLLALFFYVHDSIQLDTFDFYSILFSVVIMAFLLVSKLKFRAYKFNDIKENPLKYSIPVIGFVLFFFFGPQTILWMFLVYLLDAIVSSVRTK